MTDPVAFERALSAGDRVRVYWTCSYRAYSRPAAVVRVNRASIRVRLLEVVSETRDGVEHVSYPVGHEIVVPLSDSSRASSSNRVASEGPVAPAPRVADAEPGPLSLSTEALVRELARRVRAQRVLNLPEELAAVVRPMTDDWAETFLVVCLDARNRMIGEPIVVARGTLTSIEVHPREVFRAAIAAGAVGIVVAHNHPSGDPTPSDQDIAMTKRLKACGELVGIPLVDHVVVTSNSHRSIAEWCGSEF